MLLGEEKLIAELDRRLCSGKRTILAVDGRSGAGKSSLAERIARRYACGILHMDDFFLPISKKTPERLGETGGNVDYERCFAEGIEPLVKNGTTCYFAYDCENGCLGAKRRVDGAKIAVVEGAYSLHPYFGRYYDLAVFLDVDPELQSERIMRRSGNELHQRFLEEWIPMEERYFHAFCIRERCDFVLWSKHADERK